MGLVELVAIAAVIQFMAYGILVGIERTRAGIKAPTMTGDEGMERMMRVHMNTLEQLIAFFPALYISAQHWPAYIVASLGLVYLIGRSLYWRAYMADPAKRGLGFGLSFFPIAILVLLGLVGIVRSMM